MKKPYLPQKLAVALTAACTLLAASVTPSQADPADSLTNGLISYWDLQSTNANVYAPDPVHGYNLLPIQNGGNSGVSFATAGITLVTNARTNGAGVVRNAMTFANGVSMLGFKSPLNSADLPTALLPPTQFSNWTFSIFFKTTATNQAGGDRIMSFGSQLNTTPILDLETGGAGGNSVAGGLDFFVRQSPNGNNTGSLNAAGTIEANFSAGTHRIGAPVKSPAGGVPAIADGKWHNVTLVTKCITNYFHPVTAPIQAPANGNTSITFTWTSVPLDSAFGNNSNEVDTIQSYIVQQSTNQQDPNSWASISTNASLGYGPTLSSPTTTFTYNNATNPTAYYRIVSPGVRLQVEKVYIDVTNYSDSTALEVNPTTGNLFQASNTITGFPLANGNSYLAIYPNQIGLWSLDTVGVGGLLRTSAGSIFSGQIDDVAIWQRDLTSNEIAIYYSQGITNGPFPPPPLTVVLTAEFPTVSTNDPAKLSWLGSADASFNLQPGIGDVTAITASGAGSTNLVILSNKTYTMTVTRTPQTATSSVTVTTVSNVTANWHYIDSFDPYLTNGLLDTQGGWFSPSQDIYAEAPMEVHTSSVDGNKYISMDGDATLSIGDITGKSLKSYSMATNAVNTLFFRFYLDPAINQPDNDFLGGEIPDIDATVGITDKPMRGSLDFGTNNNGPSFRIVRNTGGGGTGGPIDLIANNGQTNAALVPQQYYFTQDPVSGDPAGLTAGKVYCVWIDVTNALYVTGGTNTNSATYSVYLQREDWPSRSNLFNGFASDRIIGDTNSFTLYSSTLKSVFISAVTQTPNSVNPTSTNMLRFDDFYISKAGLNSTFPLTAPAFPGGSMAP